MAFGTATTLSATSLTITAGAAVTITATVTKTTGTGTVPAITGPITFTVTDVATTVVSTYTGTVAAGKATLVLSASGVGALSGGTYHIAATYGGNSPNFASSTSNTLTETVNKAGTTTALGALPALLVAGNPVTLTATVTAASGSLTPTGNVTFTVNGTTYVAAGVAGGTTGTMTASFIITGGLAAGKNSISASYGGDGNFLTSTSATATASVLSSGPVTKLVATKSVTSPTAGTAFSITVTAYDAKGLVVADNQTVTVSIVTGTGTLGGTTTGTFVNGVFTFPNLTVSGVGTAYTLDITSDGVTTAVSFTTVGPPPKTGRGR